MFHLSIGTVRLKLVTDQRKKASRTSKNVKRRGPKTNYSEKALPLLGTPLPETVDDSDKKTRIF